ncbi:MAG: right-handed parallel beta-helix repeat-containing protein [Candidatus Eisenbacteria bacterium]|nr:right-handed parallel beta-helix repeat-containing protein [Candidatus Eisenbacteria bacterium]
MFRWFGSALMLAFLASSSPEAADLVVPSEVPTIEDAVLRLEDGGRIVLLPGEYTASIKPPPGVAFSLVGKGGRDSTIVRGLRVEDPIVFAEGEGEKLLLRGITFDRTDAPHVFSVIATKRRIAIEDCRFVGGAGARIDSSEGVLRRSEFVDCFDALRLQGSPILVEENLFLRSAQYGILARGSAAKIYRNEFRESGNAAILIVGKKRVPVIGGSRAHGNSFLKNTYLAVGNQSRNEINARYNYWGPAITSTMDRLGYPAALEEILDSWDQDDRKAGMVDYRNWLRSASEIGGSTFGGLRVLVTIVVLAVVGFFIYRRNRRLIRTR